MFFSTNLNSQKQYVLITYESVYSKSSIEQQVLIEYELRYVTFP